MSASIELHKHKKAHDCDVIIGTPASFSKSDSSMAVFNSCIAPEKMLNSTD